MQPISSKQRSILTNEKERFILHKQTQLFSFDMRYFEIVSKNKTTRGYSQSGQYGTNVKICENILRYHLVHLLPL